MTPFLGIDRYVDAVEQVRRALRLDRENFCLPGHSWGGVLAIEYALKCQQHLECPVISNMMSSIPAYNDYAHKVSMPRMERTALQEILALEAAKRYDDPRYEERLLPFHEAHILHMPAARWPAPVLRAFAQLDRKGLRADAGTQRDGRRRRPRTPGPHRRPAAHRRADAGDRRATRHDGPGVHGEDVEAAAARAVPVSARTAVTWRCTTTRPPACAA